MEENAGFSQCTGMLSVDAHLNTQAQGIGLTWRNVNKKDTKMQEALNSSVISASRQSCFSYKTRDPVASLGGIPSRGQTGDSRQGQTDFYTDGQGGQVVGQRNINARY